MVATLLTPLYTHNSKSKAELLRFHRWVRIQGEDTEEGVFWELCEERGKKSLENVISILFTLCHLVQSCPQPTSLEQKSASNITTDTGELSNKRSPPKEQDATEDSVPA